MVPLPISGTAIAGIPFFSGATYWKLLGGVSEVQTRGIISNQVAHEAGTHLAHRRRSAARALPKLNRKANEDRPVCHREGQLMGYRSCDGGAHLSRFGRYRKL